MQFAAVWCVCQDWLTGFDESCQTFFPPSPLFPQTKPFLRARAPLVYPRALVTHAYRRSHLCLFILSEPGRSESLQKGVIHAVMTHLHVCRVFEAMKHNGVRPGAKVVHNLIMGSIINGRKDLADAYAEEFKLNGIK